MAYRELVDLHNHILYGMDDGAASLEESAEIARQFVSEGVTRIAATPHFNADNPADRRGPDAAMVRMRVSELGLALEQENVPLSILPGNEVYLTVDVPALVADGIVCRLGDGPGLLVELSLMSNQRPLYLDELVFRLQLDGAQIVLAHPERYPFVDRDVACLDTLVAGWLLLQLTAPALLGEYGPGIRRTAERLLRRGSYSLAASDRHHPGPDRSLAALHERLSETIDVETADLLLCENPARVLEDRPIVSAAPPPKEQPSLFERMLGRRGKE